MPPRDSDSGRDLSKHQFQAIICGTERCGKFLIYIFSADAANGDGRACFQGRPERASPDGALYGARRMKGGTRKQARRATSMGVPLFNDALPSDRQYALSIQRCLIHLDTTEALLVCINAKGHSGIPLAAFRHFFLLGTMMMPRLEKWTQSFVQEVSVNGFSKSAGSGTTSSAVPRTPSGPSDSTTGYPLVCGS